MRKSLWDDMVRSLTETARRFPRRLCSVDRMVEDGTIYTVSVNPRHNPPPIKVMSREDAKLMNPDPKPMNLNPAGSFVGYIEAATGFQENGEVSSASIQVIARRKGDLHNAVLGSMMRSNKVKVTIQELDGSEED